MWGATNRGRRPGSPGFQRNRYGFQNWPSLLPSTMISGRLVVMTANSPYELIDRNGAVIRSERGGVELYAKIGARQGAGALRPGAFVEVRVPDQIYLQTVRLPETAVYGGAYVYVIEEGRMRRREVTIAAFTGSDVLIASGIAGGERVLTTQIADARDGLKIVQEGAASEPPRGGGTGKVGGSEGRQGRAATGQ